MSRYGERSDIRLGGFRNCKPPATEHESDCVCVVMPGPRKRKRPSTRLFLHSLRVHCPSISDVAAKRENQWWWGMSPRPRFSDALAAKFRWLWSVQVTPKQYTQTTDTLLTIVLPAHPNCSGAEYADHENPLNMHTIPCQERKTINASPRSCNRDHTKTSKMLRRRIS